MQFCPLLVTYMNFGFRAFWQHKTNLLHIVLVGEVFGTQWGLRYSVGSSVLSGVFGTQWGLQYSMGSMLVSEVLNCQWGLFVKNCSEKTPLKTSSHKSNCNGWIQQAHTASRGTYPLLSLSRR